MNLTQLPYELEENILEYLPYNDVINYCQTNTRSRDVCDTFFKRRAQLENIPLYLLPKDNVVNKYMQLYQDKFCIENNETIFGCFKLSIDNDNLNELRWLTSLVINDHSKITLLSGLSNYAFHNNKILIGEWLLYELYNLCKNGLIKKCNNKTTIFHIHKIIDKLINDESDKNNLDSVYYILDTFNDIIPEIKSIIFKEFALSGDINNLNNIINHYDISPDDYIEAIARGDYHVIEFLLQHYPGTKYQLNQIFNVYSFFSPNKDILSLLFKYGFDQYGTALYYISRSCNPRSDTINTVKWLLLNYGDEIPSDTIVNMYDRVASYQIKDIIYKYLSKKL